MSEYMFETTQHRKIADSLGKKLDAIAKKHGAWFVWVKLPDGYRSWFACPGLGSPFDKATAEAVLADVRAAGIAYPPR